MRTTLACGVALLVLAGCSGGDDEDAAPPTSAAAGGPSTTVRPVDTSFTGQGSAEFCNLARTYTDRSTSLAASATPAQLRTVAGEGQRAIAQAVTVAPAEIKGDVTVLSTAFGTLLSELEKVNYDATKVTPATFAPLQAPAFATSTQRFQAYVRDVCKISG